MSPDVIKVDEVIDSRYRVVRALASGGSGAVYVVENVYMRKLWAMKVLDRQLNSELQIRRFQAEAKLLAKLDHPNIVKAIDFGLYQDEQPFLIMELVEGRTVSEVLKKEGAFALESAISIITVVAKALSYAHSLGVVHRDIKPSNIMLTRVGDSQTVGPKILDFGIARIVDDESPKLTLTGEIFGTPYYMSPEQCNGGQIDLRSDIYSLGCTLFEMLTGAPPFSGRTALETMMMHASNEIPTLKDGSLGKAFPPKMDTVVLKMLAKDPEQRYYNCEELVRDLSSIDETSTINSSAPIVEKTLVSRRLGIGVVAGASLICLLSIVFWNFFNRATISDNNSQSSTVLKRPNIDNHPAKLPNPAASSGSPSEIHSETQSLIDDMGLLPSEPFAKVSLSDAQRDHKPWQLEFPKRISAGVIRVASTQKTLSACGPVTINPPEPLDLIPGSYLCERPKLFNLFRENEISSLDFKKTDIGDDVFISLQHLSGLHALSVADTNVTDDGFRFLKRLRGLGRLNISDTKITADGLLQLPLEKLEDLSASHLANPKGLSNAIGSCRHLKTVVLNDDDLDDSDLANLTKCASIEILHLSSNKRITYAGIKNLLKLKHLKDLDVSACPQISDKAVDSFVKMRLKKLTLTPANWSGGSLVNLNYAVCGRGSSSPNTLDIPEIYFRRLYAAASKSQRKDH